MERSDQLNDINEIVTQPPLIVGFKDINEVAEYLVLVSHSWLLNGYLLYAFIGLTEDVRSVILTTSNKYGYLMLSEIYDSYKMIYTSLRYEYLPYYVNSFMTGKKNKDLVNSLKDRFYANL